MSGKKSLLNMVQATEEVRVRNRELEREQQMLQEEQMGYKEQMVELLDKLNELVRKVESLQKESNPTIGAGLETPHTLQGSFIAWNPSPQVNSLRH